MAAEGSAHVLDRPDTTTPATTAELAAAMLWLQPRFTRWAMARVPQHPLAGELSFQQLTVLNLVRTEGVTLAELARRCMVAPTVITGIVDRLERQGLIRREADARDRRINRLVLTDAGAEVGIAIEAALRAEVEEQLKGLTAAELAELGRGLELLDRITGRLVAARPTKPSAN